MFNERVKNWTKVFTTRYASLCSDYTVSDIPSNLSFCIFLYYIFRLFHI